MLNGFFGESFGLVSEACAPYEAQTLGGSCSHYSTCPKVAEVEASYYVGEGYYGSCSEVAMMREIRANGPIVADIDCPVGFSIYRGGIFSDEHLQDYQAKLNQSTGINSHRLSDYDIEWEYINHSIVIVGWGTCPDTGVKFWICRNSYGPWFGEDGGHFRVKRGVNALGIESHASAYRVSPVI